MKDLDANDWQIRYENEQTGWDIGYPSPALTHFFDNLPNKKIKILIAGGGNAYELEYLYKQGFSQVFLVDWAKRAIENVQKRLPNFPSEQLVCENFFDHKGTYDLIVEQTFFCALNPNLRTKYIKKMHELLNPEGTLVGLLFDTVFEKQGPPFGGTKFDYIALFSPFFDIKTLTECEKSIPARQGEELFFEFKKSI